MRVTIWDMDFYHKKTSSPNPDLMKISSFHKQQNHLVNFVTEEFHIGLAHDIFYLYRDTRLTPPAPTAVADSPKTKVMGRTFKYYPNIYEIDALIAAVRPDYLLYPPREKDAYYNADVIQFFHKGQYIETRQPIENLQQNSRKTLVVDNTFWEEDEKNIEKALTELQKYRNVAFMSPIRFKILLKNLKIQELFLNLHFNRSTLFRFRNDIGSTATEAKKIIDFYAKMKEVFPYIAMGFIPIKTVTSDHWENPQNAVDDIYRLLEIADYAKRKKAQLLFVAPARRKFETPYWYYFEPMETWTRYLWSRSYIEMMLNGAIKRFKMPWYAILNDSKKWELPNTNFLLHLMSNHEEIIEKYGFTQWGDDMLPRELLLDEYKKYKKVQILEEEE